MNYYSVRCIQLIKCSTYIFSYDLEITLKPYFLPLVDLNKEYSILLCTGWIFKIFYRKFLLEYTEEFWDCTKFLNIQKNSRNKQSSFQLIRTLTSVIDNSFLANVFILYPLGFLVFSGGIKWEHWPEID